MFENLRFMKIEKTLKSISLYWLTIKSYKNHFCVSGRSDTLRIVHDSIFTVK